MGTTSAAQAQRDRQDRRRFWLAGVVLFGILAAFLVVVVLVAPDPEPASERGGDDRSAQEAVFPRSIPRPDEGSAPRHPGDPGSGTQLLVALGIATAVATVGALAWRSAGRGRRSRS